MSAIHREPTDVDLLLCKLTSKQSGATLNLFDQIESASIFEDMTKPTMYAEFGFRDALNMLEEFPIVGEETLEIEFVTPGIDTPAKFKFDVHKVSGVVRDDQAKLQRFILHCVSEEHLTNSYVNIKKSYRDITIDEIVPDLLGFTNTSKPLFVDKCKGTQTLLVSFQSPFSAIDMMRKRAVHSQYVSSAFVFFENQYGFHFKCIDELINTGKGQIGSRIFSFFPNATVSETSRTRTYRNIIEFQSVSRADSVEKIQEGGYRNVVRTYDFIKKNVTDTEYDFDSKYPQFETIDGSNRPTNTQNFIGKFGAKPATVYFVPKDTSTNENFMDAMIGTRAAYTKFINENVVRCLISGDSGLAVGSMVEMHLPASKGTTGRVELEELRGGNYLVKALCHILTFGSKAQHEISMDCVKIGFLT